MARVGVWGLNTRSLWGSEACSYELLKSQRYNAIMPRFHGVSVSCNAVEYLCNVVYGIHGEIRHPALAIVRREKTPIRKGSLIPTQ